MVYHAPGAFPKHFDLGILLGQTMTFKHHSQHKKEQPVEGKLLDKAWWGKNDKN